MYAGRTRSERTSTPGMFVDFHEIAERHRKGGVLGGRERIDAEFILEANQNGKAERVEAALRQHQILFERR